MLANYPEETWIHDPDLSAVVGLSVEYWKLDGDEVLAMSTLERAEVEASLLTPFKVIRLEQIDARTEELIAQGFTHAGKNFSLSIAAQIKWTGAYELRAFFTAADAFPFIVNTIGDDEAYSVTDEAELAQIYQTIGVTVLTVLGGDAALKIAVRAATTVAELNAVVDTR
jgi:hypothetical protein